MAPTTHNESVMLLMSPSRPVFDLAIPIITEYSLTVNKTMMKELSKTIIHCRRCERRSEQLRRHISQTSACVLVPKTPMFPDQEIF